MFSRRRASPQEIEEGNRQMQQAQQRLDAEIAAGSELPLEDVKGMETMVPESPKSPVKEESLGREEGPRSFPASLVPAVPGQESQVMPATPESQVKTEVKTPAQKSEVRDETSGAVVVQHEAVVPVVTDVVATDAKKMENGGSADLPRALDVSGQRHPDPVPLTPGTQSGASPPQQPLFDDQQLRRFQELFQQAPWLYPGGPVAFHQPAIQPPISRPLFLEQDERRIQETVGMGSQYVYPYAPAVRENLELKRGIEEVLEENRKLREKVERLEKAQLSQSEEDPKFSTPTGDNPKEAETPLPGG